MILGVHIQPRNGVQLNLQSCVLAVSRYQVGKHSNETQLPVLTAVSLRMSPYKCVVASAWRAVLCCEWMCVCTLLGTRSLMNGKKTSISGLETFRFRTTSHHSHLTLYVLEVDGCIYPTL